MTLICATLAPDRAWLSSDTMLFDDATGQEFSLVKLLTLPSARAALVLTGPLFFAVSLYRGLRADRPADLDEALARVSARLTVLSWIVPGELFEALLVGWSPQRGRAEGWVIGMAGPAPLELGDHYFRPLPEPASTAEGSRLQELLAAGAEGRDVPRLHLSAATMAARQPGEVIGGVLTVAEVSEAGVALRKAGEVTC